MKEKTPLRKFLVILSSSNSDCWEIPRLRRQSGTVLAWTHTESMTGLAEVKDAASKKNPKKTKTTMAVGRSVTEPRCWALMISLTSNYVLGQTPSIPWPYPHYYNKIQLNQVLSKVLSILRSFKIVENVHLISLDQPFPTSLPFPKLMKSLLGISHPQKRGTLGLGE